MQEAIACGTPALVGAETASALPQAPQALLAEPLDGPDAAAALGSAHPRLCARSGGARRRARRRALVLGGLRGELRRAHRARPARVTQPGAALAALPVEPLRVLVVALLAVAVICLVVIADYTGYPGTPSRFWLFQYLLRTQDVAGSLLLMGLVLTACFGPVGRAGLRLVDTLSRHPWRAAGVTFVALCLGCLYVEHNYPLAQDEYAALFQSRVFAESRLTGQFPPDLVGRLIRPSTSTTFSSGRSRRAKSRRRTGPGSRCCSRRSRRSAFRGRATRSLRPPRLC